MKFWKTKHWESVKEKYYWNGFVCHVLHKWSDICNADKLDPHTISVDGEREWLYRYHPTWSIEEDRTIRMRFQHGIWAWYFLNDEAPHLIDKAFYATQPFFSTQIHKPSLYNAIEKALHNDHKLVGLCNYVFKYVEKKRVDMPQFIVGQLLDQIAKECEAYIVRNGVIALLEESKENA